MFGCQPKLIIECYYIRRSVSYNSSECNDLSHLLSLLEPIMLCSSFIMLLPETSISTRYYNSCSNDLADALRGLLCSKQCLHNVLVTHLRGIVHQ